jgi:potassium channel subfamily K
MTVNAREKKLRAAIQNMPDQSTSKMATQPPLENTTSELNNHPHLANEKAEFALMREVQADVSSSQQKRLFIISTVAISMFWFLGALVFWSTEKASQSWS